MSSKLGLAMRRLENYVNPESGKDKTAKGEGWASLFISCAQDTGGLTPTSPTAIRLLETFTFFTL